MVSGIHLPNAGHRIIDYDYRLFALSKPGLASSPREDQESKPAQRWTKGLRYRVV